jgi:hypothetical protein
MKVITTIYKGPGNTRGSIIIAKAEGVGSIRVPYNDDGNQNPHQFAAEKLAKKYNWGKVINGGTLPDGKTEVWVFASMCKRR